MCTLRDFAKFAELLLYKGEYKGEQILSRWFMEKATSKQISNICDNHFTLRHEQGKLTYENTRGVKTITFGYNSLLEGTFPETSFYDKQVETPANRELNSMNDLSWTEEKKILLRNYIVDTNFGSRFMTFGFKGKEVGVMMNQRGEFFLRDYAGFAGWVAKKTDQA